MSELDIVVAKMEEIHTDIGSLRGEIQEIKVAHGRSDERQRSIKETLGKVHVQTKETNGRVGDVEKEQAAMKGSIRAVYAVITLIIAVGAIIVAI